MVIRPGAPSVCAAALIASLAACAPGYGPDDTVSLTPVGPEARAARDAALRGPGTATTASAGPAAVSGGSTAPARPLDARPGRLGDDATFTGGAVPQVAPTPSADSYREIAPRPLPSRPAGRGPGVVAFALETTHPVGQPVYPRSAPSADRAARACARYPSDDLAQAAFLAAGGPGSDGQGLDPDGDGYACDWNPERFRSAVR